MVRHDEVVHAGDEMRAHLQHEDRQGQRRGHVITSRLQLRLLAVLAGFRPRHRCCARRDPAHSGRITRSARLRSDQIGQRRHFRCTLARSVARLTVACDDTRNGLERTLSTLPDA
jgi:hypothetical protein